MSAADSPSFPVFRPLADVLLPRPTGKTTALATDAVLVVVGSLLVAVCARVVIPLPFTPVPITGQTFGVLLGGMLLGPKRGTLSLLLYLCEGAAGFPVFQGGTSGLARLLGPTAGYLWSYPFAAALMGTLAKRGWDRCFLRTAAAMLLGGFLILAIGTLWLAHCTGDLRLAFVQGCAPFLFGDMVKTTAAAALLPGGWRLLDSQK